MRAHNTAKRFGAIVATFLLLLVSNARAEKPNPLAGKMGLYIHMINAWGNSVHRSREDFYQVVDAKVGLTCKESKIGMLQTAPFGYTDATVKDVDKLRAELKKAPKLDTDAAANRMLDAMRDIFTIDNRVTHYFSNAKFQADDCKRGKEMQATLLVAWPKFFAAEQELRGVVEKYSDERDIVRLAEAEKKFGKGLHYYQLRLLIDAKALIRVIDVKLSDVPQDPSPIREKAAALKKSHAEVQPIFTKFAARDDAGDTAAFSYMFSHVRELYEGAERRAHSMDDDIRRKGVNKYSASEISKLIKSYNDMVEASNRIEFSKAAK